jgi:predicted dehydrogenase
MRIGFAGLIHGHVWGLIDRFAEVPGVQLAAVADPTPLIEKAQARFVTGYSDWREMLDKEQLDGLVVTSDNLESSKIVIEALGRGIPCMKEKPMAASAEDAQKMLEAWENSGVTLMINWPFVWNPWTHDLYKRMFDPALGHPFHLRYRNGHHGPKEIGCDDYFVGWLYDEAKNGGGAIADFCGYGAVLCRWLMGMPESVFAVRDNYTKDYDVPDDHAICVLKYPKSTAILEGTWATFGFDQSANPVLHAKNGTIGVYGNEVRLFRAGAEPEVTQPSYLPGPDPASYFVYGVEHNKPEPEGMLSPRLSADACRIIDAAKKSARSGCGERP